MLKRIWLMISVGLLVGLSIGGAAAQEPTDEWAVTIFDRETGSLQVITAAGLQPGPELPDLSSYGEILEVRLAPKGQYVVFQASANESSNYYVADLITGNCCTRLQDTANPNLSVAFSGPFNPDGSQIAVSMFDQNTFGEGKSVVSFMVVFDLATGSIAAAQPLSALQPEDEWAAVIVFGEWKADGIRAVPSCYACEGVWEGLYRIWNPETNTVSEPVEPFDIFMNRLPGTGEVMKYIANSAYPQNGRQQAYFPPANVVEYYSSIQETEGQVVYFNPDNPGIESADWVADGQAIALKMSAKPASLPDDPMTTEGVGDSYLLFRDGHQVNIHPDLGYVLAGTPDGWISRNWTNDSVALVTLEGDSVTATALGTHPQWNVAGTNFTLGANPIPAAFPLVAPPEPVICPGFVQSRLWRNTFANITPGEPNNLRAEASTSSAMIGEIPGGETVAVLDGPVCGENMTWWQVQHDGRTGWTVEGQGSTYWIEPIVGN